MPYRAASHRISGRAHSPASMYAGQPRKFARRAPLTLPLSRQEKVSATGQTSFLGKYEVFRCQLENGLDVILLPDAKVPVVSCQTWFRVGSRDEHPGITGIAHLLEHLMFKETTEMPEGAFSRILEEAGARDVNAWTWCDETVYTQSVPKHYLELVLKLESDRMANLALSESQLNSERGVVLSERQLTTEDDPFGRMYEMMCQTAFDVHSYRWPVIGSRADIENMSLESVTDFYRRFYAPNNAALILAGDLEVEATLALISRYYGSIPSREVNRSQILPEPVRSETRRVALKLQVESDVLQLGFLVPGLGHSDRPALTMLDILLLQGRGSRLMRRLVNAGIASSVDGALLPFRDPYLYEIQVTLREGHSADEAEAAVMEELARLIEGGVRDDELHRARQKYQVDAWQELRDSSNRANFVGIYEVAGNGFEAGLRRIQETLSVTSDDICAVAKRYFRLDNATILTATPVEQKADAPESNDDGEEEDPALDEGDASEASVADEAELTETEEQSPPLMGLDFVSESLSLDVTLPSVPTMPWKVTTQTLPNHGELFVVEEDSLPLVSFQIIMPGGMALETAEQEGLANLMGDFLLRGTRRRTREEFEDALDALGATLDVIADVDHLTIVGSTLATNFEALMALLTEALTEPLFSVEEFHRLQGETLASIRDSRNDDKSLVDFWFGRTMMSTHPYGRSTLGVPQTIERLTPADIASAHERMVHGNRLLTGVAGAVSVTRASVAMESLISVLPSGDWIPEKSQLLPPLPSYDRAGTVLLVDKPDRSQVQIMLGHRSVSTAHPDYPLLSVGNIAFGGHLSSSRLMQEVREKRGWSYGASSRFDLQREAGNFQLWVFPSNADLIDCTTLVKGMLKSFQQEGLTEDELEYGKRVILNGAAFDDETPERSMRGLLNRHWQGTDRAKNLQRVASATREEVNRALREQVNPDALMGVMVCDVNAVRSMLEVSRLFERIETIAYDIF